MDTNTRLKKPNGIGVIEATVGSLFTGALSSMKRIRQRSGSCPKIVTAKRT
jgi:hypothetical protein